MNAHPETEYETDLEAAAQQVEEESAFYDGLFYPGGGRRKAVESLEHFSRYGNTLLFLRACIGGGKSAVLQQFMQCIDSDTQTVFIQGKKTGELLRALEQSLGIRSSLESQSPSESQPARDEEDKADFQPQLDLRNALISDSEADQVKKYCEILAKRGRRLLVVVDDVDRRHHADLDELVYLAETSASNLKLVLSGTESAGEQIRDLADRRGVLLNSIELNVFSVEELAAYTKFRMDAEGAQGESVYSDLQVETAWQRSEGSLHRFHQLLKEFPVVSPKKTTTAFLPLPHIFAAGLLIAVMGVLFLLRGEDGAQEQSDVTPIVLEKIDIDKKASESELLTAKQEAVNDKSADLGLDVSEISEAVSDEVTTVDIDIAPEETAKAVLAAASEAGDRSSPIIKSIDKSINKEVAVVDKADEPIPSLSPAGVVDEKNSETAARSYQSSDKTIPSSANKLASDSAVHERLLAWPDTGYALQLFGTHNKARAEKLVKDYFSQADLLFYETRHDNKPWFVVINGPYSGSESARRGIDGLPDGLKGLRPWPRNVVSIKRDIKRYHR